MEKLKKQAPCPCWDMEVRYNGRAGVELSGTRGGLIETQTFLLKCCELPLALSDVAPPLAGLDKRPHCVV